ncbi:50S ribosomal protein L24 [candidate division WOR-3 bacterium]|nr:50S ribosomal protein L24 [candidate division WOR-3 bacterium]MCK4526816.1 50S ribosomal protein L24 [candidate division WOR-3 bacterium]
MRIKKGDIVVVIRGNYKDKKGKVMMVFPKEGRLIVEGVNMQRRHTRPKRRGEPSGILEKEGPIQHSNVMVVCPSCGEATRVGIMKLADGKRARYCKKCNELMER